MKDDLRAWGGFLLTACGYTAVWLMIFTLDLVLLVALFIVAMALLG